MKYSDELELLKQLNVLKDNKEYSKIIDEIAENEDMVTKKYYDIATIKIDSLIHLEKYIDALLIIIDELKMPYIPKEFESFLTENKRYIDSLIKANNRRVITPDILDNIDKMDDKSLNYLIEKINEFNLKGYENKFQIIFDNKDISDLTKTLLIAMLQDHQIDHNYKVVKNDVEIRFNPSKLGDYRKDESFIYIQKEFRSMYDIAINVNEGAMRLSLEYLLSLYPLVVDKNMLDNIICASLVLYHNMLLIPLENEKYSKIYELCISDVDTIIHKMNKLI